MSHPQRHLRVFLDGGPRNGETVSIAPADDGSPPERIVLADDGPLDALTQSTERGVEPDAGADGTPYELSHTDMGNSLWVYRPAVPPRRGGP